MVPLFVVGVGVGVGLGVGVCVGMGLGLGLGACVLCVFAKLVRVPVLRTLFSFRVCLFCSFALLPPTAITDRDSNQNTSHRSSVQPCVLVFLRCAAV